MIIGDESEVYYYDPEVKPQTSVEEDGQEHFNNFLRL